MISACFQTLMMSMRRPFLLYHFEIQLSSPVTICSLVLLKLKDLGSLYLGPLENILRRLLSSSMNIIYDTDAKSGFYPALKLLRIKSKNYRKLRIISFSDFRDSSPPRLKEWIMHKISDIVELQNCLLCHSFLKGKLPTFFESFFQSCSDVHNAPTRFSKSECFYMPRVESVMAWIPPLVLVFTRYITRLNSRITLPTLNKKLKRKYPTITLVAINKKRITFIKIFNVLASLYIDWSL